MTKRTTNYNEVKRKAKVGERIRIVNSHGSFGKYENGHEYIVSAAGDDYGLEVHEVSDHRNNPNGYILDTEYVILEPAEPSTLTEMPKVGDKIRYVGDEYPELDCDEVYEISGIDEDGDAFFPLERVHYRHWYVIDSEYERGFDQFELIDDVESLSPQSDRDLIVELSQTVAKLKREAELNDDFIAETLTRIDDAIERLTDDVCMLDERTQPLTDSGAQVFAEGLSDVIEQYVSERLNSDQLTREQIRRSCK